MIVVCRHTIEVCVVVTFDTSCFSKPNSNLCVCAREEKCFVCVHVCVREKERHVCMCCEVRIVRVPSVRINTLLKSETSA